MESSADQKQLLRELLYPLRRNQSCTLYRTSVVSISSTWIAWRYQFTKLSFSWRFEKRRFIMWTKNAAVSFHFVQITQTGPLAVKFEGLTFLGSPFRHQLFFPCFPQFITCWRKFSYCLECNLLL